MNGLPPTSTRTDSLFPYTTLVRSGRRAERRTGTAAVVTARGHDAECGLRREMPGQTELRQESLVGFVEREIGRAHVCTPVTNAHLVCRLLIEKKKTNYTNTIQQNCTEIHENSRTQTTHH